MWNVKSVVRQGDTAAITLSRTVKDDEGNDKEETQTVRHYRTSFGGKQQTPIEWRANVKREVKALLASLNASEPQEEDITSTVS